MFFLGFFYVKCSLYLVFHEAACVCVSVHACGSQYGCLSPQCCLYETVFKAHSVHILKRRVWTTLKAPSVLRLDYSVPPPPHV